MQNAKEVESREDEEAEGGSLGVVRGVLCGKMGFKTT